MYPKIIIEIIRLMGTGLNLTQAWQIIIIDFEYTLYAIEQNKGRITKIG